MKLVAQSKYVNCLAAARLQTASKRKGKMSETPQIGPASPFFIVSDLESSLRHYQELLGFECSYKSPDVEPFFAMITRGSAQLMIKEIGESTPPQPNHHRHEWAPWDAFIYTADPDRLASEFARRGAKFHQSISDNDDDNLCGFAVADPDGYVCYFGRPR